SWKPEHTVTTQSLENDREVRVTQGFGEVHVPHRRPENLSRRLDRRHDPSLLLFGIILRRSRARCVRCRPPRGWGPRRPRRRYLLRRRYLVDCMGFTAAVFRKVYEALAV